LGKSGRCRLVKFRRAEAEVSGRATEEGESAHGRRISKCKGTVGVLRSLIVRR